MFKRVRCLIYVFLVVKVSGFSQEAPEMQWWNPITHPEHVIEGQAWANPNYERLPKTAEGVVREAVWQLSRQSAGLSIHFISNSPNITVKYKVKGDIAFNHMPATGVSGVDLYVKSHDGEWLWNKANYSFGDTITYSYTNLEIAKPKYHNKGQEYVLYLPLYNDVEWLEIGTEDRTVFKPLPVRREKPIVIYGTSIMQGACASRPGMAWSSILGRHLDRPIINLGFSGNGRLEPEVLNYMKTIEAKVFVLDCLPNLTPTDNLTLQDVYNRIVASVKYLKSKHISTPILLVEHSGYSDGDTNTERLKVYSELNITLQKAYNDMVLEGVKNLYVLTKEELNLGIESYVDGTHPNDLGMMQYAKAYETSIREIINEPIGNIITMRPITQNRDANVYNWTVRHQKLLESNKTNPPKVCFIGNSIVHQWGGIPDMAVVNGADSWYTYMDSLGVKNFGYGWDRIENVLWRVYHEEFDGYEAEQILLKIGTNNLHLNTNEDIVEGIGFLVKAIKERQPNAKITLIGILPRRDEESRIKVLNNDIEKMAKSLGVYYLSVGDKLLNTNGLINESLFRDGLHPNAQGYRKLAPLINTYLLQD